MKKLLIALLAGGVFALLGCATPQVSLEAKTSLLQAEADLKQAEGKKADTSAAKKAYQMAKDAAAKGDSDAVMKYANQSIKESLAAIKKAK
ncbi:MAG: hypothetical protein WD823_04905 [Sulfuricaulis sp.]|uniref:hypothetical protein n=1 Tax=Sulfuricaulis sp. TaxID=2003553 RepID=UPI0034A5298F